MGLADDEKQSHVSPGKLCELKSVVALLQRAHKEDETCKALDRRVRGANREFTNNVQHKAYEPVVSSQGKKNPIDQQDVFEVVDDTFSIEKIHDSAQEIPVQRLCKAQTARPTWHICYGNHLLEGDDLDGGDGDDDVDVAGEQGYEEAGNHDKGPYCARDEVCLFLLILILRWGLFVLAGISTCPRPWNEGRLTEG
jgi:hypothetical protein